MTHILNTADLKNRLSEVLAKVEKGDDVLVCKRNVPVAKIESVFPSQNQTRLGFDRKVEIVGSVEGPVMPEEDWHMMRREGNP